MSFPSCISLALEFSIPWIEPRLTHPWQHFLSNSSPGQVHSPSTFPTPNFTAVIQSELQDTKTGNSGPPAGSCVTHQGERSAMVRNHLLNAFNYCSHHQNSNYNRAGLESKLKLCSVEMLSPKPAVGHGKILFFNNVSIAPLLSATSVLFLRA